MSAPDLNTFCQNIVRSKLLTEAEAADLRARARAENGANALPEGFADWLVNHGKLTRFQADSLLRGNARFFLDEYKLLERVGTGRMAGVYRAVHKLGMPVAVKVLPPSKAKDTDSLARFKREAELALQLDHPHVVRTYHAGLSDGLHYIAMEYLEGETLEEYLAEKGKLPPAEAVRIVHQALEGLEYIHSKGMVHRDIKPGNLMLLPLPDAPGEEGARHAVKLLDVGLGRALFDEGGPAGGDLTTDGTLIGTPDYMAPEQARNSHAADVRSDIYSLGCVLYQCLTGRVPFTDKNVVMKLQKHATEMPAAPDLAGYPRSAELQAVLWKMIAKDPGKRFPSPAAVSKALAPFLATPVPVAAPVSRPRLDDEGDRPSRPVPRKASSRTGKRLVMAAAAIAIGLLLGIGIVAIAKKGGGDATGDNRDDDDPDKKENVESDEAWTQRVAGLKPDEQVSEVVERLKKKNPGFDGKPRHKVQEGVVTELELVTDDIKDISPVKVLSGLIRLACTGSAPGKGKLADLKPLQGMNLGVLDCGANPTSDLSPLAGMPLIFLGIAGTQVRDLSPVKDMPLMVVNCAGAPVRDLSPLRGKKLTLLDASGAPVDDLSLLRDMPLESLWCNYQARRDADWLLAMTTLKEVNGKPIADLRKEAVTAKQTFDSWVKRVAAMKAAEQVNEVKVELKKLNPDFDKVLKATVKDDAVVEVEMLSDAITDLSPLRALPKLRVLVCHGSGPGKGRLANLHPLKGLPLTDLDCAYSRVADLTPLKGMKLTTLNLDGNTALEDLAPLKDMKLTWLNVAGTQVRDLAPLRGMGLTYFACHRTPVRDLTPLQGMPLTALTADIITFRDLPVLRSLMSLATLNNKPWREFDQARRDFEVWAAKVATLPVRDQPQAISDKLRQLNPDYDGKLTPKIDGNAVTEVTFVADGVTDLSPVRALPQLKTLIARGSGPARSKLDDLWPLRGLPLTSLAVGNTAVSDLTPLEGMRLERLDLSGTPVSDLSVLRKMPVYSLDITQSRVDDLAILQDLPLKHLKGDVLPDRDADLLEPMKLLTINGKPAADFLKPPAAGVAQVPRPAPRPTQKKVVPVVQFQGQIHHINHSDRRLVLRARRAVIVQSPYHTYHVARIQRLLILDQTIRDPRRRLATIQQHLLDLAYHQERLFHRHDSHQDIPVQAAANVKVRTLQAPKLFDEKGNIRKPTQKDLDELKGPDKKLPGYTGEFVSLKYGDVVDVYLARIDAARLPENPAEAPPGLLANAPLEAVMIVVVIAAP